MVGSGFVYIIWKISSKLPSDKMEGWRDGSVLIKLPHPTPPPEDLSSIPGTHMAHSFL